MGVSLTPTFMTSHQLVKTAAIGLLLAALCLLPACAPAASKSTAEGERSPTTASSRSLAVAVRVEPASIATRILGQPGAGHTTARALFNATIALMDDRAAPRPYLVESLPQLNTNTWRVFPDGRMETTYRLKPLVWHDGAPLSSDDFVFAWRVYLSPDYGFSSAPPFHAIDEVVAVDPQTVLMRWSRPYPRAADLSATNDEFPPLPTHILREPFEQVSSDAFTRLPYWSRDYVGVGPYRLDRWEPGTFLEGLAFDRYVLGRPRIERFKLVFIADPNTVLANLLAGSIDGATDNAIGVHHLEVLRREWGDAGRLQVGPGNSWRLVFFQFRPELVTPRSLLEPRVRKALAHAVDKQAINEVVGGGAHFLADTMLFPTSEFGPAADAGAIKYPYNLRRSEQLMNEAGFFKGGDGVFASAAEGRFTATVRTAFTADFEEELFIMADGWRKAGFDVQESVIPAAQAQDAELGANFPSMLIRTTFSGTTTLVAFTTSGIPRPATRWRGTNRGGWSNAEYDGLVDAFNTTLDPTERARQVTRMARIYTEDMPHIPLYFPAAPFPHVASLHGLQVVAPEANRLWNVHEWEFRP